MTIENTADRDPMLHMLGVISEKDNYITNMESAGQQQLVNSDEIPTDAPWGELEALGFVKGERVPRDDLFTRATLPAGWKREASDHAMWSYIVDERGIRRVSVFYKAAFYDRNASASITSVAGEMASNVRYGDTPVELPAEWPLLTADERTDFADWLRDEIRRDRDAVQQLPALDNDGRYTGYIARAERALELVALANGEAVA
ncbi:hypothetical protein [Leifsonia sp. NPDC058248]|uniref:hypothetical protein n=1 Tax=Leifsonia sp. NPDC058248 TaxID=3346402 RepID=UPI0036DC935E